MESARLRLELVGAWMLSTVLGSWLGLKALGLVGCRVVGLAWHGLRALGLIGWRALAVEWLEGTWFEC